MRNDQIKNLKIDHLITCDPQTTRQEVAFAEWKSNNSNLVLNGSAGTGKTFIALYLALETVLDKSTQQDKIVIVRSVVPTREIGFLPGTLEEKLTPYTAPYQSICSELFEHGKAYELLTEKGVIEFHSTSFLRGRTFDNCIIIVDEVQNCSMQECDSVITRVGENTRMIVCGDYYQSDLIKQKEREGVLQFLKILEHLNLFSTIEFTWSDIVRSDMVRDYIMTKEMMKIRV